MRCILIVESRIREDKNQEVGKTGKPKNKGARK